MYHRRHPSCQKRPSCFQYSRVGISIVQSLTKFCLDSTTSSVTPNTGTGLSFEKISTVTAGPLRSSSIEVVRSLSPAVTVNVQQINEVKVNKSRSAARWITEFRETSGFQYWETLRVVLQLYRLMPFPSAALVVY